MFGSNYFGQPEFGQGAAEAEALQFKSVSASVTVSASLSSRSIINKIVTATITATGSIAKQFQRTLATASVVVGASLTTRTIAALNVVKGLTKFLTPRRTTRNLTPTTESKGLSGVVARTTRRIREE